MLARLVCVGQSGISVRRVGGNRAGEMRFTRFLRNRRVRPDEMVATARARTTGLVQGRHILAIQDTTTLRDDGKQRSLNLHPMIAVDAADGALLGLVDAVFLNHIGGKKHLCKKRPFAEKESRRWLDATNTAASLVAGRSAAVRVIKLIRDYGAVVTVVGLVLALVPQWTVWLLVGFTAVNGLFLLASIAAAARASLRRG